MPGKFQNSDNDPAIPFDPNCRLCDRLALFMDDIREEHPDYHCRPVPAFGVEKPGILIVGLAPGKHGANASGRPFTGDFAGVLLYETLYKFGLASHRDSVSVDDELTLTDTRITNAVKCLPPGNKPATEEVINCNRFLAVELDMLLPGSVVIALGLVAHKAILRALGYKQSAFRFGHGTEYELETDITLIDSYHCSRYNTQTRRLTPEMFENVFVAALARLGAT
jgi:uracil-DNA glycosylase family 4